eukprot:TRINITY_DN16397_c0_g1_i1.p1 TRINITY_DN16397_c0_g1~~TRINITY_DN16397_c0_g1_i1.p1  ORF type:complete len:483 (-),score=107.23 TRINITY_DN16397_c0_g1_i1:60-1508(-)
MVRLWRRALLCLLPGVITPLADDTCPAGGCTEVPAAKDLKCVRWRQTGACSPKGPREKEGDKNCDQEIGTGSSGYCQCGSGDDKIRARAVTCDHRPFSCATECLQALRYTCLGWRQTGGCNADGPREEDKDQPCTASISPTMSGYCECGGERRVRKPGCANGEWSEPFTCADECAAESDLYEELNLDSGASDKEIKQAFRKMSLKFHPDKTRNDPALSTRFSQIREAYDIIGDAGKRAIYDAAGLKMLYESTANKVEKGPAKHAEVSITLEQLFNGEEISAQVPRVLICRGCDGENKGSDRCEQKCRTKCANEIEIRNVRVQGMGNMVMQQQVEVPSKQKCRTEQKSLMVVVERGMSDGDTVQFPHMGEQQPGKIPGDVVVKLKEIKHAVFRRTGADLHTEVNVTLSEALLGFERTVKHLDGRTIHVGYTGVTKPSAIMRVTGEGMPHRGDPTERGNLYVKCNLVMPEDGRQWLREMQAKDR